jgi:hypothetical protein
VTGGQTTLPEFDSVPNGLEDIRRDDIGD